MIAEANQEIRLAMRIAQVERRERQQIDRPFSYLDKVIQGLGVLHLTGLFVLPENFLPRLEAVRPLLPPGVQGPRRGHARIARVIDQCFDLQERILRAGRRTWHEDAVA